MCRLSKTGIVFGTALAALVAVHSGHSEEPKAADEVKSLAPDKPAATKAPAANRSKRRVVALRYGSAKELAAVLEKHFQGEAEIQAAPEPAANSLLISAKPDVFDEVMETLTQLDCPSKKVIVDVLMFDVETDSGPEAGKQSVDKEKQLDERDLAGPIEKVLDRLENLHQQKKISNLRQLRVETLDNRQGQLQSGEEKPRINGFNMNATTKVASPIVQNRVMGTNVSVTPRVVDTDHVSLELVFRNDRFGSPEDGIFLAQGEKGPIIVLDVLNANLQARLTVTVGQATVVARTRTDARSKPTTTRIIVAARIAEEAPPSSAKE
jgi:type II secretory pathway component GspD/PulD (secretin)